MTTNKSIKKGHRLANPAGVMTRYSLRLQALVKRMTNEMNSGLNKIAKSNRISMDAKKETKSLESQLALLYTYINSKWTRVFQNKAPSYSKNMVIQANNASKSSVNGSINKLKEGFNKEKTSSVVIKSNFLSEDLKKTSRDIISKNIDLIKKIPGEYVNQFQVSEVKEKMINAISKGDLDELNKIMNKHGNRTERRTQLMAEDQVRKSFNGISAVRLQDSGITKFEWLHSGGGQFPRELHIEYDGEIFNFNNLPVIDELTGETGIPGQAINCRCTMNPIIEL